MGTEVINNEDLEMFRQRLLADIQALISVNEIPSKEWLRSIDVRKLLKISPGTLQSLRITGRLPFSKINGIHFYKRSDIENMLSKNNK